MAHRLTPSRIRPLAAFAILLAGCAATPGCSPPAFHDGDHLKVAVNGHAFDTELKLTPESRTQGMGGRLNIADDFAMLFAYPEPRQMSFVMRDCHFPIAVLFLDAQGRVVKTHAMPVEKPGTAEDDLIRYPSEASAQFALEVKAGQLEKLGVVVGQTKVELPLEALGNAAR